MLACSSTANAPTPKTAEPATKPGAAVPASGNPDLIHVSAPSAGSHVTSPLHVAGEARGTWFFEASFPVKLLDAAGNVLVQAPAQAKGEWMTEAFVPFELSLSFEAPSAGTGTLVLEKDNPSGLPEHADELRIPVVFGAQ
jgi:hypothetical protein